MCFINGIQWTQLVHFETTFCDSPSALPWRESQDPKAESLAPSCLGLGSRLLRLEGVEGVASGGLPGSVDQRIELDIDSVREVKGRLTTPDERAVVFSNNRLSENTLVPTRSWYSVTPPPAVQLKVTLGPLSVLALSPPLGEVSQAITGVPDSV